MGRFKHAYSLLLCLCPSHFCLFYLSFLPRSKPWLPPPLHSSFGLTFFFFFFFFFGFSFFFFLCSPPPPPPLLFPPPFSSFFYPLPLLLFFFLLPLVWLPFCRSARPTDPSSAFFRPVFSSFLPLFQNRLRENYQILSFSRGADSSFKLTNTTFMRTHACTQIHISFRLRCPSAAVSRILIGWFVLSAVMWLVSALRWESHPLIINESQWD